MFMLVWYFGGKHVHVWGAKFQTHIFLIPMAIVALLNTFFLEDNRNLRVKYIVDKKKETNGNVAGTPKHTPTLFFVNESI